jgi:hypothetical protein
VPNGESAPPAVFSGPSTSRVYLSQELPWQK